MKLQLVGIALISVVYYGSQGKACSATEAQQRFVQYIKTTNSDLTNLKASTMTESEGSIKTYTVFFSFDETIGGYFSGFTGEYKFDGSCKLIAQPLRPVEPIF